MNIRRAVAAILIAATLGLSSCGGSKGSGDNGPEAPSNNWDSMVWDQGSWA